ncbi:MAG TPA: lipocalin family protein [Arenibacter sp.]|nr:lipocalin family protein [Arenibacter sp.]
MHIKKSFFLLLLSVGFLSSCSVSKSARQDRSVLNGYWILSNVSYEGNEGRFNSVLFNDAEANCFESSNWFFRNNNSTGSYVLANNGNCDQTERFIRWSVIDREGMPGQLQFKFIDDKYKDISGGIGYRLDIVSLNATHMTLNSKVTVDGEPITVVYEFSKNDQ